MEPTVREWIRPWAGPLAVVVGLTLVGSPALAGQLPAPAGPKSLRASATTTVAALDLEKSSALSQEAVPGSSEGGKSFVRSKKGVAVLVLMAGAITWAIVSRQQDAIHSPAR